LGSYSCSRNSMSAFLNPCLASRSSMTRCGTHGDFDPIVHKYKVEKSARGWGKSISVVRNETDIASHDNHMATPQQLFGAATHDEHQGRPLSPAHRQTNGRARRHEEPASGCPHACSRLHSALDAPRCSCMFCAVYVRSCLATLCDVLVSFARMPLTDLQRRPSPSKIGHHLDPAER